jgi:hypothetical protein
MTVHCRLSWLDSFGPTLYADCGVRMDDWREQHMTELA